jgi:hypothetical protein
LLAAAVVALALAAAAPAAASVQDHPRVMACHRILLPAPHSKARIARFIKCAGRAWGAPAGAREWLKVAECESGLYWRAGGADGPYVGVYQHGLDKWPWVARHYLRPLGLRNLRWQNPEGNVIAAMRMARADGDWATEWSCA